MSNIQSTRPPRPQQPISATDSAALKDASVQQAVSKLAQDVQNNSSKDTIDADKQDAFAKYQAAGGQATSIDDFGREAASSAGAADQKKSLRQAFDLHRGGSSGSLGISGPSTDGLAGSSGGSSESVLSTTGTRTDVDLSGS